MWWRRCTSTANRNEPLAWAPAPSHAAAVLRVVLLGALVSSCLPARNNIEQASTNPLRAQAVPLESRYRSEVGSLTLICLVQTLVIVGLLMYGRRRALAQQMLADRLRFETVLADASHNFADVTGERVRHELEYWLSRFGVAAGADQLALLLLNEDTGLLEPAHHWQRARGPVLAFDTDGNDLDRIRRGLLVTRALDSQSKLSATLMLVPLSVGGQTWGALAIETHSAASFRGAVPLHRLRLLGEVLAHALARNRAAAELEARSAALTSSHAEYQRLADRLIEAQENERRRIARELHDDITQRLTLIGLEAGEIGRRDGEAAIVPRSALERLSEELSSLIGDVTRLSHRLHPTLLGRVGLSAAVRALCRDLTGQQGLQVTFVDLGVPAELPEAQALALYRVAQEALRNALKHSGAHRAAVQLGVHDAVLVLEVSDDGQGFDPERPRKDSGLGLLSMTERVQVLEGTLTVQSRPGSGTTVRVVLPLTRDAHTTAENR